MAMQIPIPRHDPGLKRNAYVDEVFGPTGPFAKAFPGYQPRDGQVEFSQAVADAIDDKRALLAEAGTGVGKSLGYLVPALKSINEHGGKVVVVTANIALQEQIVKKDLPMLRATLGFEFSYSIAKGFAQYICPEKSAEADAARLTGKRLPVVRDQEILEQVFAWPTETGDLSEFDVELPGAVRQLVTTSSDECYGKKCRYYSDGCFPRMARKRFGNADVIVTNYHLYFLDLELKRQGARGVLPEHRILICDEAHAASEIARKFLGLRMSFGSIKAASEDLDAKGKRQERFNLPRQLDVALKAEVEREARHYFDELLELRRDKKRYRARLNKPGMTDGAELERSIRKMEATYRKVANSTGVEDEAREWLRSRADLCAKHAGLIASARSLEDDEQIFYIDDERDKATLVREPVSPADTLRTELFEKDAEPRAIVLCSATLATNSKTAPFAYAAEQVGVRVFDECIAESPFDFTRSAFVVPKGLPDPGEPEWPAAVGEVLVEVVQAAGGRTLGLFTSYRVLDLAHKRLLDAGLGHLVLRQGEAPRSQLIKRFKEVPESILLGTDSFWTGVDVPGDSLVAVVIDKMPFDHFEDPVLDAIKQRDEKWFKSYYLPKAVIKFKQGLGRLIRSVEDYGVVVCCDRRVTSKPYGRSFRNAAPLEMAFSDKLSTIDEILNRFRKVA